MRTCPSNPDAHRHYAETLWHRGQRPAAIAELADALSKDPEDANLHVRMAEMRLAMGETESALKTAEHAIDLDPKLASAWAVHARVMRARKNLHEALANYHRALGYNSSDRQIPLEIAEVYRETGRPERALATLQALAESYTPGDEPQRLLHLEGLAYFDLARYSDSAHSLAEAAQRGQPSPDLLFHLARRRRGAGEVSAAAETARQVLALDPRHESGRQLVEEMELVQRIDAPPSVSGRSSGEVPGASLQSVGPSFSRQTAHDGCAKPWHIPPLRTRQCRLRAMIAESIVCYHSRPRVDRCRKD